MEDEGGIAPTANEAAPVEEESGCESVGNKRRDWKLYLLITHDDGLVVSDSLHAIAMDRS